MLNIPQRKQEAEWLLREKHHNLHICRTHLHLLKENIPREVDLLSLKLTSSNIT